MQPQSDEKSWLALIVDDHSYMRGLIRTMLQQIGIKEAEEFESGEGCLRRIQNKDAPIPDFIIVDWHMHGMDGYTFCNKVRLDKDLRVKNIPIIMVTGEKDRMLLEQAWDMGVKAVLNKPVSLPKLKEAVYHIISVSAPVEMKKPGE